MTPHREWFVLMIILYCSSYQLVVWNPREQGVLGEVLHHPDVDLLHIRVGVHQTLGANGGGGNESKRSQFTTTLGFKSRFCMFFVFFIIHRFIKLYQTNALNT